MGRKVCGFIKGSMVGLLAGSVLGAMGMHYMHHNRRGVKRNVGRALRTVGDLTDSLFCMF